MHVVIKVFDSVSNTLPVAVQAAIAVRQSQAWYQLKFHPNIAKVFDAGWGCDRDGHRAAYIAMEYIPGCTLKVWREHPTNRLTGRQAANAVRIMADALASMWEPPRVTDGSHGSEKSRLMAKPPQPILHQDISPNNVLVHGGLKADIDGKSLKLIDFGGGQLATDGYTAPERKMLGAKAAEAWDIYSLGAILYFLLVGDHPAQPPAGEVDFSRLPSDVEPELAAILQKSLAVDPIDRYATRKEMAADLERYVRWYPLSRLGLKYSPLQRFKYLWRRAGQPDNERSQEHLWGVLFLWFSANMAVWNALCWLLPTTGMSSLPMAFWITGLLASALCAIPGICIMVKLWRGSLARKLAQSMLGYVTAMLILRAFTGPGEIGAFVQIVLCAAFTYQFGVFLDLRRFATFASIGQLLVAVVLLKTANQAWFTPMHDATAQAVVQGLPELLYALALLGRHDERSEGIPVSMQMS